MNIFFFFLEFRQKRIKFNIKSDNVDGRPLYLDAQATTPLVSLKINYK